MSIPTTAAEYAACEVGTKEATGRNDGDPWRLYMPHSYGISDRNGDGKPDKGLPWCAGFVLEMYRRAGNPIERNTREAWEFCKVSTMFFALQRRGWETTNHDAASLIFYKTRSDSDAGKGSHVGIVEDVDDAGIHTIEGNLGDAVRRRYVSPTSPDILGFIAIPKV